MSQLKAKNFDSVKWAAAATEKKLRGFHELAGTAPLDAVSVIRELLEARKALRVESADLWSDNRTKRLNAAMTRESVAEAAARQFIANAQGESHYCTYEQDCEYAPWCRIHANCRRKVLDERTRKACAHDPDKP